MQVHCTWKMASYNTTLCKFSVIRYPLLSRQKYFFLVEIKFINRTQSKTKDYCSQHYFLCMPRHQCSSLANHWSYDDTYGNKLSAIHIFLGEHAFHLHHWIRQSMRFPCYRKGVWGLYFAIPFLVIFYCSRCVKPLSVRKPSVSWTDRLGFTIATKK